MDFGFSQCLGTLLTRNYTRGNIYCRYTCTGVVCLRKFSSFVCEVKWENEKNIFLCVLEWREFISLVRTRVVLLLIFIHGWLLLFTFTLGSCLQVMSNWEKRQKNLLYENILEILDSHTVVWGTYAQFGLRVEKVVIFFCLHSQPSLVMSNSVWPQRRKPTRILCPWDSSDKNSVVACHFLLPPVSHTLCISVSANPHFHHAKEFS